MFSLLKQAVNRSKNLDRSPLPNATMQASMLHMAGEILPAQLLLEKPMKSPTTTAHENA